YILLAFDNLMDYMQLIGAMFISPFFVIFFLGMIWKRVTPAGGFFGMLAGVFGCMTEYALYRLGVIYYRTPMAATLNLAIWGGVAGLTTACVVSLFTKPRPEHELAGLVFGQGRPPKAQVAWFRRPPLAEHKTGQFMLRPRLRKKAHHAGRGQACHAAPDRQVESGGHRRPVVDDAQPI